MSTIVESSRIGRPSRERAGEVDRRILDAAGQVFLERGFSGASVDEITAAARVSKPTIYARFGGKEALFTAVIRNMVDEHSDFSGYPASGEGLQKRLEAMAMAIVARALVPKTVGLIRASMAEATRFPDLALRVHRLARQRGNESVSRILSELAVPDGHAAPPDAFAPGQIVATAQRFIDLVLLPQLMRALFGEDLGRLKEEAASGIAETVKFFCRGAGL